MAIFVILRSFCIPRVKRVAVKAAVATSTARANPEPVKTEKIDIENFSLFLPAISSSDEDHTPK